MAPTIRVDEEVYKWLQSQAVPFDDSPNSVLRRIAGLDAPTATTSQGIAAAITERAGAPTEIAAGIINTRASHPTGVYPPGTRGDVIVEEQKIPVAQGRYAFDGRFYEFPTTFPAALCGPWGYVVVRSGEEMAQSDYFKVSLTKDGAMKVNVAGGISSVPGYSVYGHQRKPPGLINQA